VPLGFDAGELFGELVQMASCFQPVRVQGEGPLGGFDRLDEGLLDEVIVTGLEGVLLDLVVRFAQNAIRKRAVGILPDESPGERHQTRGGCAGVVESTELPLLHGYLSRVVPEDTDRRRDHGIREAEPRTPISNRGNECDGPRFGVSVIRRGGRQGAERRERSDREGKPVGDETLATDTFDTLATHSRYLGHALSTGEHRGYEASGTSCSQAPCLSQTKVPRQTFLSGQTF
jgi:hypothetical protein